MPLFDKMKTQASQVAQKAQEAGKAGQAKLEQAQAKRQSDLLLRQIGAAVYAQRTGGETTADVDQLVAALKEWEAQHGSVASADDAPGDGEAAADAPAGDFKLE
jgi:hypothetical protein